MRTRVALVATCAVLMLVGTATGAGAGAGDVTRSGSCSGRGEWRLRVRHETATTIRVRFTVEHLDPGDTWQLFVSDNGTRIVSASRVVDAGEAIRVTKVTANRDGDDRIRASGVNVTNGGSCDGALTYRA